MAKDAELDRLKAGGRGRRRERESVCVCWKGNVSGERDCARSPPSCPKPQGTVVLTSWISLSPQPLPESPGASARPVGPGANIGPRQSLGSPEPWAALPAVSGAYPAGSDCVTLVPRPRSRASLGVPLIPGGESWGSTP